jgi:biopolymer transport protein ExbD
MAGYVRQEMRAEPNLVPILDMVFQLMTFFMLVVNFKGAEADLTLQLPVLGSARPVDTDGQEKLLVLNIDSEGRLKVYGVVQDFDQFIATQARLQADAIATANKDFKYGDELPTTVVVRADKATPFGLLNEIVKTCQEHGYRKFALNAVNRREE